MITRLFNFILRKIHHFEVYILPKGFLKNLMRKTPYQEVREKIWKKLGNELGIGAYINHDIILIDSNKNDINVRLGDRVALAPYVTFITSSSPNNSHLKEYEETKRYSKEASIVIGKDTWVGTGTIIQPGVTIGKNCIIGSMSNVTKDIPDNVLAYGNPAKIIKELKV